MYTEQSWAEGAYQSGDAEAGPAVLKSGNQVPNNQIVSADGSMICAIELKQSGKGRKVAYSEATFRIRPAAINALVAAEISMIMSEISKSPL